MLFLLPCYGLIAWFFRRDMVWRKAGSLALLIPGAWIAIQGSRPVAYWFGDAGGSDSHPVTTFSFAAFLISAVIVLLNRNINWGKLFQNNKTLFLIYGYFLLSVFWSEMPWASSKRIIKDFGGVLVALIFLTEKNPIEAIRATFVRVSYILFPLSVIFIKYFPEIGRQANRAGENMFTGVTTQKNSLGETVFVFGLMVLWDLVEIRNGANRQGKKIQIAIRIGLLLMGLWLLITCNSQTSLLCLIIGIFVFWGGRRLIRMEHGKRVLVALLLGSICVTAMDKTFGISDGLIRAMGRDPSLTGRTEIWRVVLEQQTAPLVGHGFYVFWDTGKGTIVKDELARINTAHNGYLEAYVDGGLIGVALLGLFLLAGGRRIIEAMFAGNQLARIGLIFWILAIIYNLSESSFLRLDVLWFTLLLVSLDISSIKQSLRPVSNARFPISAGA